MRVTTELVIARHGEAECNLTNTVGGERGCTGLSPLGRHQAARLAARLTGEHAGRPYGVLYSSPRLRAAQTAAVISDVLGLPVAAEPAFREPDCGTADGQDWDEVIDRFGGPPQHHPGHAYAPGAETWHEALGRVMSALSRTLAAHEGSRVVVVGHAETVEAAHCLLLGLVEGSSLSVGFTTDCTGIARWQRRHTRFGQAFWALTAHNDTTHLGPG